MLKGIVEEIKNFEGLLRKKAIKDVIGNFTFDEDYEFEIIEDFGDDAAVIGIDGENAILLAADGIWGKLLEKDPWWAGYCSVLVNCNDIAAMGGKCLGMTNIISMKDKDVCREVLKGVKDGIKKFGVPMVGGHTHPDAQCNVLDVAITGIAKKDKLLLSRNAKVGDKIIFAYDLDGKLYENFPLNWDTTTMKPKKLVKAQLLSLVEIAENNLANSCKDISNPGAIGTLGMLLELAKKGGIVDITKIPKPEEIELVHWLKVYPGSGFVLTAKEENVKEIKRIFEDVNITAEVCGEVKRERKLYITDGKEKELVFDFEKEFICGC
ncbi:methanogenesis marker protein 2 [Methanocaldococcus infernus ME]|uniref:Methanogenesis marker protein 2 n=1 Tax=Methanocaldococcus infernus (strain DSM 11812 / JCM 15783 / ME) TaxID=573063 RepID=D5VS51_METIM|nr:methanogenesis marker 2 protein [Methanocaldococcus infernus]ADG13404.1 methanogenesis marker protein 2 [Methanocaldococcus infernus ME]